VNSLKLAVEIVGWTGAALILGAYALLSAGKVRGESVTYHMMNMLGGVALLLNSAWNGAMPSAALNLIWTGIAVYALCQRWRLQVKPGCAS
jgi:hypothetical protein